MASCTESISGLELDNAAVLFVCCALGGAAAFADPEKYQSSNCRKIVLLLRSIHTKIKGVMHISGNETWNPTHLALVV